MIDSESVMTFEPTAYRDQWTAQYREVRGRYEDLSDTAQRIVLTALDTASIRVHSVEGRAKTIESFGVKASKVSATDPTRPKYANPLHDITDLAAIRVITFLPKVVQSVCNLIDEQFLVIEKSDKAQELLDEGRFGYQSVHYLVKMHPSRIRLPEYARFEGLTFEIQIRTLLQHAWAEMEHDIQYKSATVIPSTIRRRFIALAGMLEMADREFEALLDADERLRTEARTSVESGHLTDVEITPDSLKAYLDRKLGPDGRIAEWVYEMTARYLKHMGFTFLTQLDECIGGYDDDYVCRVLWGSRMGQVARFEAVLLASMGEVYAKRHPWSEEAKWIEQFSSQIERMRENGVSIGNYDPLSHVVVEPN